MKNFLEQVRNERQLKALVGLGKNTFEKLLEEFTKSLLEMPIEEYKINRENRLRRPGGGRKGNLVTAENKLCLVLFYLKNYPTFDLLGDIFGLSRSKAEENYKKLSPVLKNAQSKLKVLPLQRIKSVKELEKLVESTEDDLKKDDLKKEASEPTPITSIAADKKPLPDRNTASMEASEPTPITSIDLNKKPLPDRNTASMEASEPTPITSIDSDKKPLPDRNTASMEASKPTPITSIDSDKKPLPDRNTASMEASKPEFTCSQEQEILKGRKEVLLPLKSKPKKGKLEKLTNANKKEIYIDVTERKLFRHKNYQTQKRHFSGKKHDHTIKHTIISNSTRKVLYVGRSFVGSVHDYKMLKKELPTQKDWFRKTNVCVDLGYQGIKKDYASSHKIQIPHKKPRKSKNTNPELTRKQKSENKKISSRRVVVEHAIGGMKAFNILSSRFRNKTKNLADEAITIVAGLWNLKISS
jgi:hypothetical protein